jgi:hypothetical protein
MQVYKIDISHNLKDLSMCLTIEIEKTKRRLSFEKKF